MTTALVMFVIAVSCAQLPSYVLSDIEIYAAYFNAGDFYGDDPNRTSYEIGWRVLNDICSSAGLPFNFLRIGTTIFYLYCLYKFLQTEAKQHVVILVACMSFTFYPESYFLRSSLAGGIGFFAISRILQGQKKVALVYIALGTLFHVAALVLIPLLLLPHVHRGWRLQLAILMALLMVSFTAKSLGLLTLQYGASLDLPAYLLGKIELYLDPRAYRQDSAMAPIFYLYGCITGVYIWLGRRREGAAIINWMALYALAIMVLFWDIPVLSERASRLLLPVFFVILGRLICAIKQSDRVQIYLVLLIFSNVNIYRAVPVDVLTQ